MREFVRGEPLLDSIEMNFCKRVAKDYNRSEEEVIDLFKHNVDEYPAWDPFELTLEDLTRTIEKERGIYL